MSWVGWQPAASIVEINGAIQLRKLKLDKVFSDFFHSHQDPNAFGHRHGEFHVVANPQLSLPGLQYGRFDSLADNLRLDLKRRHLQQLFAKSIVLLL